MKIFEGKRSDHPVLFLSKKEKSGIVAAIRDSEKQTSGEIRVHLTGERSADILSHGKEVFEKLGMTKTAERNGVLILIATRSKKFVVLADQGIHSKMDEGFLGRIALQMEKHFKENHFAEGIVSAIEKVGNELKTHFPHRPDDQNELSNEISYSR